MTKQHKIFLLGLLISTAILVVGIVCFKSWLGQRALLDLEHSEQVEQGIPLLSKQEKACSIKSPPIFEAPATAWQPEQVALVVNNDDPQSIAVAKTYQVRRRIPEANIIHISLPSMNDQLEPKNFTQIYEQVSTMLSTNIQAIALSFSRPIRVGCMSITSAFALGYKAYFCDKAPKVEARCRVPQPIATFRSKSHTPFTDFGIRPTMMIAGRDIDSAVQLIDRGVKADHSFPTGNIFLVHTTDPDRSVRYGQFLFLKLGWNANRQWQIHFLGENLPTQATNLVQNAKHVLFYFTGLKRVPKIQSNQYEPGAIADHLTSLGGDLYQSRQMSALRWLEAGATGSYGTVVEPCNFPAKFPDPSVVIPHYFQGESLLEAYWKSVASPQEGLFIGDPLAQPMGVSRAINDRGLVVKLSNLVPHQSYQMVGSDTPNGAKVPISEIFSINQPEVVEIALDCRKKYYSLVSL